MADLAAAFASNRAAMDALLTAGERVGDDAAAGGFMRGAKTGKAFLPMNPPPTVAEARARLMAAVASFEAACTAAGSGALTDHPLFGKVPVLDYVRFQEVHTRHHTRQIPGSA